MNLPSGSEDYPLLDDQWTYDPNTHTDTFDPDEWEEAETTYLVLDTVSKLKSTDLLESKEIQVSGLNSAEPYVRIGTHVFKGQYENLIGSEMILAELPDNSGQPTYFPTALTKTHLHLSPITLEPINPPDEHSIQFLSSLPHPGPKVPVSAFKKQGLRTPKKKGPASKKGQRLPADDQDATVVLPAEAEEFDFGEDAPGPQASTSRVDHGAQGQSQGDGDDENAVVDLDGLTAGDAAVSSMDTS